jgi:L-phenylalanine/L-methionine N-acetyltransferase
MIRKAGPEDFDFFYELYMHPLTNPYLLYEHMSKTEFQPIFDDLQKQGVIYVYADNGIDTGMFKLVPYTHRTSHIAYLGGLAIHPGFSGKGQGYKMILEILDFGRKTGFLRIELSVASHNEKAIHLYLKSGFEKEGVLRKYTHLKKENRFWDEVLMSYLYEP